MTIERWCLLVVLSGVWAAPRAEAQAAPSASVTVRVRDERGAPVPHAVVDVSGGRLRVADDSGRVVLNAITDTTRLQVRRMGYAPFFERVGRNAAGEMDVTLHLLAQALAPVTVEGRRDRTPLEKSGFYDRVQRAQRGAFNADFITPEELDARLGVRTSDLFYGRRFVFPDGNGRQKVLKGRGGCKMTIYLDGQMVRPEGGRGGGSFEGIVPIDDIVNTTAIAAIEIYASAANAPAEMIPLVGSAQQGACGIVALWTGGRR